MRLFWVGCREGRVKVKGEVVIGVSEFDVGVVVYGKELRNEGSGRSWRRNSYEGWRGG